MQIHLFLVHFVDCGTHRHQETRVVNGRAVNVHSTIDI